MLPVPTALSLVVLEDLAPVVGGARRKHLTWKGSSELEAIPTTWTLEFYASGQISQDSSLGLTIDSDFHEELPLPFGGSKDFDQNSEVPCPVVTTRRQPLQSLPSKVKKAKAQIH